MNRSPRILAALGAVAAAALALTACTGGGRSSADVSYWGAFSVSGE